MLCGQAVLRFSTCDRGSTADPPCSRRPPPEPAKHGPQLRLAYLLAPPDITVDAGKWEYPWFAGPGPHPPFIASRLSVDRPPGVRPKGALELLCRSSDYPNGELPAY